MLNTTLPPSTLYARAPVPVTGGGPLLVEAIGVLVPAGGVVPVDGFGTGSPAIPVTDPEPPPDVPDDDRVESAWSIFGPGLRGRIVDDVLGSGRSSSRSSSPLIGSARGRSYAVPDITEWTPHQDSVTAAPVAIVHAMACTSPLRISPILHHTHQSCP
ncbi:hypothetical protein [Streptomyces yaizuensis]|uniref:Uncharacterized protein n=1 Tax=Streptomyces yaizuensis TaxID=2989713 RepID=A0ABQ5NU82_9ACTN|nr:hypothetical protein [Streptomyces sp. YSPA8]GLF93561.1 hypothetical protein SYYSPA8_04710 [Streptomyces sp. YSPA8]